MKLTTKINQESLYDEPGGLMAINPDWIHSVTICGHWMFWQKEGSKEHIDAYKAFLKRSERNV